LIHRKIDPPSPRYGAASNRWKKSWISRVRNFFTGKPSVAPAKMRIDLYATCWNEERMIPFFLRHYEPIVDRIVIFDDGSTDCSLELLAASPKVELRRLKQGESSILMQMEELNRCWKESRGGADWVMICDIDEHLYHHKQLRGYLEQCKSNGVTIINPIGYDMVNADFPEANSVLAKSIRRGIRSFLLDKKAVFDPSAIEEINYTPGRHIASPTGRLVFPPKREVKILHYKYLGLDYLMSRSADLNPRKTDFDRARGWGVHDQRSPDEFRLHFDELFRGAEDISLIGKFRAPVASDEVQRRL
jgi:glycosyltransferase involved in cell wall biosynthesis